GRARCSDFGLVLLCRGAERLAVHCHRPRATFPRARAGAIGVLTSRARHAWVACMGRLDVTATIVRLAEDSMHNLRVPGRRPAEASRRRVESWGSQAG